MSDVDLFNIVTSPSIAFLPHDSRILLDLIDKFGKHAGSKHPRDDTAHDAKSSN